MAKTEEKKPEFSKFEDSDEETTAKMYSNLQSYLGEKKMFQDPDVFSESDEFFDSLSSASISDCLNRIYTILKEKVTIDARITLVIGIIVFYVICYPEMLNPKLLIYPLIGALMLSWFK